MTNLGLWVDYSAGRPGGAALKAAGIVGALRYLDAGSPGKLITAVEYTDLVAHGVRVLLVVELGVHDAEGGYSAGVVAAQRAVATARSLGIPDSVGIASAADEHLSATQVPTSVDYVRGFRDVLGLARTGCYGFAEHVDAVHTAAMATWFWKCGSAPTASESWVNFWQRNTGQTTISINGVVCDLNEQCLPIGVTDMATTDPLPVNRPDGTVPTEGEALGNLYIAAFYGGPSTGGTGLYAQIAALTTAVSALSAKLDALAQSGAANPVPGTYPAHLVIDAPTAS